MKRPSGRYLTGWAAATLVVAGAAAYANSLTVPFVSDDLFSIPQNPSIRHLWPLWRPLHPLGGGLTVDGRPVLNLSLALNYAVSGNRGWSYHVFNLAIHLSAALVLFGVVRRTGERLARGGRAVRSATEREIAALALAVALLWELHPLQTESVTYTIQRAESLMGLFYLLTLYGFIRAIERGGRGAAGWWLMSWLACLLGMGTKEVMVSAPVIVLAYDACFVAGSWREALGRRRTYYLALGATWFPLAVLAIHARWRGGSTGPYADATLAQYWLTQPGAIARYLRLAGWPAGQIFDYGAVWIKSASSVIPAAAFVGSLALATAWGWWGGRRRGWAPAGFLGLWFFALLAPTSLIPISGQPLAEHRMYLPLIPVLSAAVGLLVIAGRRTGGWRPGDVALLGLALALPSGWATHRRNEDYAGWGTLFAHNVALRPDSPFAQADFGAACVREERFAEAVPHLEAAIRLKPGWAMPEFALGAALMRLLKPAEAEPYFRRAIRDGPEVAPYYTALFTCLVIQGRTAEAMNELVPRVRDRRSFAGYFQTSAREWVRTGRTAEGIALSEALVRALPGEAVFRSDLGIALANSGRWPEAADRFREASRLDAADAQNHCNLAAALLELGRKPEAIAEFEAAVRLAPGQIQLRCSLADALADAGRLDEARAQYRRVLRADPDSSHARERLARLGAAP